MVSLHQECISYIKQRPPQSKYHNKPYAYNWMHCQSPPTSKSHFTKSEAHLLSWANQFNFYSNCDFCSKSLLNQDKFVPFLHS